MKKVICSILAVMLLFAGCSVKSGEPKKIDDYKWQLDIVQNSASAVIASSKKSTFDCDNELELTAKAKDGALNIVDLTNNKNYVIKYTEVEIQDNMVKYRMNSGSVEGVASVSVIKNGNKSTPTLYITLGGYSIRFVSSK